MTNFKDSQFDSRDLAKTMEIEHKNLIRMINTQISNMVELGCSTDEWFVEHTYRDYYNRPRKCFMISQKGRDLLFLRMTGEKGVLLAKQVIDGYHEIEEQHQVKMTLTLEEFMKDEAWRKKSHEIDKPNSDKFNSLNESLKQKDLEIERLTKIVSLREQELNIYNGGMKHTSIVSDDVPW